MSDLMCSLGVKNDMPAEEHLLDILLNETRRALPKATWTAAGIGRHQVPVMGWALARGADAVRTGLEDNIRISKDQLANSNADLVERAVANIEQHGARAATPQEARKILRVKRSD
jgi:3-keto-5-aminohexanoate cleavage enzyme